MDTTYFLDGVALDDSQGRWFVDSATEAPPVAGLRATSVIAPGLDGALVFPGDSYEAGVMSMTVNVTDIAGSSSSYAAMQQNLDVVKGLFASRHRIHVLRKVQGGTDREISVRVTASTTPKELDGRTTQVKFLLDLPVPLWRDTTPVSWVGITAGTNTLTTLAALAGATAPCTHGTIIAQGPLSGITLVDENTGRWLTLDAPLSSVQAASIQLSDLTVSRTGGVDLTGVTDVGPGGFSLTPDGGTTRLRMQRQGGSGLVRAVDLRRSWL